MTMSDLDVLRVVCPNCKGERVRLVSHGDRFTPAEYEECENPVCVGGGVPSDALLGAVREGLAFFEGNVNEDVAVAVLRLIEEGTT